VDADPIARWADLLVGYCLEVERGETIVIASELEALPLVEAAGKAVVLRGAHPLVRLEIPGMQEFYLEHASPEQLTHLPPVALLEAEAVDGRIRIAAERDAQSMSRLDPRRLAAHQKAMEPVRRAARQKRWVLTQYPTAGYAAAAGMALADYEAFVARALFLDQADPSEAWRDLGRRQAALVEFMSKVDTIRVEADGTDLSISVAGRTWINSDGRRNMPSGEIFSGPIEDSANGRLRCGFPVCRDGRKLEGIELELRRGEVVAARAEKGEDYLVAMLDLDGGARRLGEIGLGLNPRIDRFTGSILFDEKIGGTVHFALGQSYPETGGVNASALHWDLIVDSRSGGRIWADRRLVMDDGKWLVG
jgi:aminopeptidase